MWFGLVGIVFGSVMTVAVTASLFRALGRLETVSSPPFPLNVILYGTAFAVASRLKTALIYEPYGSPKLTLAPREIE